MSMKVFVTGASGFVGRNLVRELVATGATVHAIARSDEAMEQVKELGAVAFRGDLSDKEAMRKAAEGCTHAVHTAASIELKDSYDVIKVINVDGTQNFMDACRAAGVKRVVHVSSCGACLNENCDPLIDYDQVELPEKPHMVSGYARSKWDAEKIAFAESRDGMEVIIVRPPYIWGNDNERVMGEILNAARSGDLKWFNGGHTRITTCHVTNVCEGIIKALTKGKAGKAYFLTDNKPITFKEHISAQLLAYGVAPPTGSVSTSVMYVVAYLMETFMTRPLLSRATLQELTTDVVTVDTLAREELGYEGRVTYEEGIEDMKRRYGVEKDDEGKGSWCGVM